MNCTLSTSENNSAHIGAIEKVLFDGQKDGIIASEVDVMLILAALRGVTGANGLVDLGTFIQVMQSTLATDVPSSSSDSEDSTGLPPLPAAQVYAIRNAFENLAGISRKLSRSQLLALFNEIHGVLGLPGSRESGEFDLMELIANYEEDVEFGLENVLELLSHMQNG